jgi:serine/threonine protein kinase
VKPANILIEGDWAYLADFGIASIAQSPGAGRGTLTGEHIIGTPAYMAPEQARAQPLNGRADFYAFAVVLYEALTGRRPYLGSSALEIFVQQEQAVPAAPHILNPALPRACTEVLLRGLAFDPDSRYSTGEAFLAALSDAVDAGWPAGAHSAPISPPAGQHRQQPQRAAHDIPADVSRIPPAAPQEHATSGHGRSDESMLLVPASASTAGAGEAQHVLAFYIDHSPVTNDAFRLFVEATGAVPPPSWKRGDLSPDKTHSPVTGISWQAASAYAVWTGKRLPTAVEWDSAARICAHPVSDTAAGFWEWTATEERPRGLGRQQTKRVLKGMASSGLRERADRIEQRAAWPDERNDSIGFRCARSA